MLPCNRTRTASFLAFCHFPHETEETQAAWTFTNFILRPVDRVAVWHSVRHLPDRSKVRFLSGFPACPGGMAPNASNALSNLHQILNWGFSQEPPWKEKGWEGLKRGWKWWQGDAVISMSYLHLSPRFRSFFPPRHRSWSCRTVRQRGKASLLRSWQLTSAASKGQKKTTRKMRITRKMLQRITWKSNFFSPGGLKLWPH